MFIRHPGGVEVSGEVTDVQPPQRIAFTYGYATGTREPGRDVAGDDPARDARGAGPRASTCPMPLPKRAARDEHVQGWRYQLSLFGNLVAAEAFAGAAEVVDGWFAAWSDPDASTREATLTRIASDQSASAIASA